MRILVVGAGAIGGYFGGRLLQAGRDVTFLVRPQRAAKLAQTGLRLKSPAGDFHRAAPPTVLSEHIQAPYDLVLLSCKAYDLAGAIDSMAPAVGPQTLILPLLNGMRHLDDLDARFGAARVLGGQCIIPVTLDGEGTVVHLAPLHAMTFGARNGAALERVPAIGAALSGAMFELNVSDQIEQSMWEKWVNLGTLASATCLMRAAIGDILAAPLGAELLARMLAESCAIAAANGHAPREAALAQTRGLLGTHGSPFTASMLRDLEQNARIEADHVVGDLLARRGPALAGATPLLDVAYTHLKAYEARRARSLPPV